MRNIDWDVNRQERQNAKGGKKREEKYRMLTNNLGLLYLFCNNIIYLDFSLITLFFYSANTSIYSFGAGKSFSKTGLRWLKYY